MINISYSNTPSKIDETSLLLRKIDELVEQNKDLLGMIHNSYDAMCVADSETRLLLLNPAFEKLMGLKNSEMLGRKIIDNIRDGLTDASATIKVLESGKEETVIINTISGRKVLSTGVPVYDRNGKINRVYCNLRDVTDLNFLKEKYEQSQRLASKYLHELHEYKKKHTAQTYFVAHNAEMKQILDTAYRIANINCTVLILGETGVGKDLIAQIIHEASPRKETGAYVKINCGAIPAELLESELFGYEAGAFTGAKKEGKIGYFEVADKGTIFLDEIGELPLKLQVKLLTVIQDQKITRIGGVQEKEVDVRILAATNRDLEDMMRKGQFREDLYYRLNVVPILIPPLRDRKDDIPFLLMHFLEKYNHKYHLQVKFSKEVVEIFSAYEWPGNIRELANIVERLIVVTQEPTLKPEHLPQKYISKTQKGPDNLGEFQSLKEVMEKFELELIVQTISECKSREEAAHKLGISLSSLTRRIRKLKESSMAVKID